MQDYKKVKSGRLTKQSINNRGYNKYLRLGGTVDVSIDMGKFEVDTAWDGIKGYVTKTRLTPEKVIDSYGNLWFIERAFRFNKFDLAVRPIYHRLRNRIEGHICICFTSLHDTVGVGTNSEGCQIGHNHTPCAGAYEEHVCHQLHTCAFQTGREENTWTG